MNEQCDDCGGLLGVGGPHVCDPGEVEIVKAMKQYLRDVEAEKLEASAFYLSTQVIHPNDPSFTKGYNLAIRSLRDQAALLRQPFPAGIQLCDGKYDKNCRRAATFHCKGDGDGMPEHLRHEPHHSCYECDRGVGCLMAAGKILGNEKA